MTKMKSKNNIYNYWAKAVSYSNNSYSSGRKASDDYNFGKGDSDCSFSKWTKKTNDTESKYK